MVLHPILETDQDIPIPGCPVVVVPHENGEGDFVFLGSVEVDGLDVGLFLPLGNLLDPDEEYGVLLVSLKVDDGELLFETLSDEQQERAAVAADAFLDGSGPPTMASWLELDVSERALRALYGPGDETPNADAGATPVLRALVPDPSFDDVADRLIIAGWLPVRAWPVPPYEWRRVLWEGETGAVIETRQWGADEHGPVIVAAISSDDALALVRPVFPIVELPALLAAAKVAGAGQHAAVLAAALVGDLRDAPVEQMLRACAASTERTVRLAVLEAITYLHDRRFTDVVRTMASSDASKHNRVLATATLERLSQELVDE